MAGCPMRVEPRGSSNKACTSMLVRHGGTQSLPLLLLSLDSCQDIYQCVDME